MVSGGQLGCQGAIRWLAVATQEANSKNRRTSRNNGAVLGRCGGGFGGSFW